CIQLIINRLLFARTGPTIYVFRGRNLLIDHSAGDQEGTRACISPGLYDAFFAQFSEARPIRILDLGANSGGFPLALFKHGFSIERGLCVELNPRTFNRLEYNLASVFTGQIIALNAAVTGKSGSINVSLGKGSVADNIYEVSSSSDLRSATLPALTFDELVAKYLPNGSIDICKMDIEGAEYEALEADTSQSLGRCRHLVIEMHGQPAAMDALNKKILARNFSLVEPQRPFVEENVYWFRTNILT
ncbi:MAG TPA: FkbM family methyltransferase, partial [Chthoniobacterales bacterium]